jgi:hypothetical protein
VILIAPSSELVCNRGSNAATVRSKGWGKEVLAAISYICVCELAMATCFRSNVGGCLAL